MEEKSLNEYFRILTGAINGPEGLIANAEDKEEVFKHIAWHIPGGIKYQLQSDLKEAIKEVLSKSAEELDVNATEILDSIHMEHLSEILEEGSKIEISTEEPTDEPSEEPTEPVKLKWDGVSVEEPEQDEDGIYLIATPANLAWLAENVASTKDNVYKLTEDIDLDNKDWNPIGTKVNKIATPGATWFEGTLDGDGHTISNLLVRVQDEYAKAGLFGLFCGTVKNLKIDNATIHSTHYAAVIAPYISDRGKKAVITNCEVTNSRVTDHIEFSTGQADNGDKAAIFVGYVSSDFEVSNCKASNVEVEGYRDIAILVGFASQSKTGTKVMEVFDNVIEDAIVRQNFQDGYKDVEEMTNRKGTDLGFYEGTGLTKCSNNVGEATLIEINVPGQNYTEQE